MMFSGHAVFVKYCEWPLSYLIFKFSNCFLFVSIFLYNHLSVILGPTVSFQGAYVGFTLI